MRWLIVFALLAGCGDNNDKNRQDAGMDATSERPTGCIDEPSVPMAPNGQLPCDLIPPGLTL